MAKKLTKESKSKCFKQMNKNCGAARKNPTCASKDLIACFKKEREK